MITARLRISGLTDDQKKCMRGVILPDAGTVLMSSVYQQTHIASDHKLRSWSQTTRVRILPLLFVSDVTTAE